MLMIQIFRLVTLYLLVTRHWGFEGQGNVLKNYNLKAVGTADAASILVLKYSYTHFIQRWYVALYNVCYCN